MGMYSDNRFDNELTEDGNRLSENGNGLSEEEMARATEVIVPAPDATPTPGNQASGNQAPGNQEAADVSQEDFPSAALLPDAGDIADAGANHVGGAEAPDPLFGGFGSLCADI